MERHLELRETREWYQVGIDAGQLEREPIVLEKDGAPVAAVISYADFHSFQKWRGRAAYRPTPEFLADGDAFRRMLPELMKTHKAKYVAIFRGKLVDSDDVLGNLARRVYEQFGYQEIYMARVEEPRVYRIPSAWAAQR
ncbi:MAG: hypothetical protein DCC52_13080 [Chloroflexi bacterium]|nr:MAG: hypothetical protein DCC52_13080 [Chloroflexota bacterium]